MCYVILIIHYTYGSYHTLAACHRQPTEFPPIIINDRSDGPRESHRRTWDLLSGPPGTKKGGKNANDSRWLFGDMDLKWPTRVAKWTTHQRVTPGSIPYLRNPMVTPYSSGLIAPKLLTIIATLSQPVCLSGCHFIAQKKMAGFIATSMSDYRRVVPQPLVG